MLIRILISTAEHDNYPTPCNMFARRTMSAYITYWHSWLPTLHLLFSWRVCRPLTCSLGRSPVSSRNIAKSRQLIFNRGMDSVGQLASCQLRGTLSRPYRPRGFVQRAPASATPLMMVVPMRGVNLFDIPFDIRHVRLLHSLVRGVNRSYHKCT